MKALYEVVSEADFAQWVQENAPKPAEPEAETEADESAQG